MSSLDAYLEPPDPQESVVCDSCECSDCICDLPDDLARESEMDDRN